MRKVLCLGLGASQSRMSHFSSDLANDQTQRYGLGLRSYYRDESALLRQELREEIRSRRRLEMSVRDEKCGKRFLKLSGRSSPSESKGFGPFCHAK